MILSKETILQTTSGGRDIYRYILSRIYPEIAADIGTGSFLPTFNPFHKSKNTLVIRPQHGVFRHYDMDLPGFRGTAIDFAQHYFCANSELELLLLINKSLELGLNGWEDEWEELQKQPWNPQFSYFAPPISNIIPDKSIGLKEVHQMITGGSLAAITEKLRSYTEPKRIRSFKAKQFPYVTFSGVFSERKDDRLIKDSNLMVVDLDHLREVEPIKRRLLEESRFHTELLFISPSGKGLKWVLRKGPADHRQFLAGINAYLKKEHQLEADPSGADVSRACFLSHDPECYLHPEWFSSEEP